MTLGQTLKDGDTKRDYHSPNSRKRCLFVWRTCPNCHNGRWLPLSNDRKAKTKICFSCFVHRVSNRLDPETVKRQYLVEGLATTDMAKIYGCTSDTISIFLRSLGITIRDVKSRHNQSVYIAKQKKARIGLPGHPWTPEQRQHKYDALVTEMNSRVPESELRRLYTDLKMPAKEIARLFGVSYDTLRNYRKRYGISFVENHRASYIPTIEQIRVRSLKLRKVVPILDSELVTLYTSGKSIRAIARSCGCSDHPIRRRLVELGIQIVSSRKAHRSGSSNTFYGKQHTMETKAVIKAKRASQVITPESRKKVGASNKKRWESMTPEQRSLRMQHVWDGCNTTPNIPETAVLKILDSLFPNEWKYVGDGSLVIDGLNPDFVNINGQKKIIEVFGDYWHTARARTVRQTEDGRVEAFKQYGYDTLVIWEHEVKNHSNFDNLYNTVVAFGSKK